MSNGLGYNFAIIVRSIDKHHVYTVTDVIKSIHRKKITKSILEPGIHSYKFRIWNTPYEFTTHP